MSRLQEARELLAATEGRTWASYSSASGERRGWETYPLRDLLAALAAELEEFHHWNDGPICEACDLPRECPECGPLFVLAEQRAEKAEARVALADALASKMLTAMRDCTDYPAVSEALLLYRAAAPVAGEVAA